MGRTVMGRWVARLRHRLGDEQDDQGSVLLLTLGYATLALAAILVCTDATSLYLAQKNLDALADSAALAGADGFHLRVAADGPHAVLTSEDVQSGAVEILTASRGSVRLVSAQAPGGAASRVTVATTWHPPVVSVFVPEGFELAATATSRTAFR